jgi:hypothetical protein
MSHIATVVSLLILVLSSPQASARSIVLLLDVTTSVSQAMATVTVSAPVAPRADGTGSFEKAPRPDVVRQPNTPIALFLSPVVDGVVRRLPPGDELLLGRVARTLTFDSAFGGDRDHLSKFARELLNVPEEIRHGPTPLWDALDVAITRLTARPHPRAVVLVTDGLSTGNRVSFDYVLKRAVEERVAMSIVCETWGAPRVTASGRVNVGDHAEQNRWHILAPLEHTPDFFLRRLATATGGLFLSDGDGGTNPDLQAALTKIVEHLRRK